MTNTVLIRVDASYKIGAGHLLRCLSIGNYLKAKGIRILILTKTKELDRLLTEKEIEVKIMPAYATLEDELNITKSFIEQLNIKIMILDINYYNTSNEFRTYHFYLKNLNKLPLFLISFEDFKDYPYTSDIVIIPYFGAEGIKLHKKPTCKYLLGPRYFILRDEFLKIKHVAIRKKVESILDKFNKRIA